MQLSELNDCYRTPRHRCVMMHEGQILSYAPQFNLTLRNKGYNVIMERAERLICHYQQNVPQRYYLLDTLAG